MDLDTTPGDDTAWRLNPTRLEQFDAKTTFNVSYGTTSHHEIAYSPSLLNRLNNGTSTTLTDVPAGFLTPIGPAGDMEWALQWDILLAPGDSFSICKDCELQMLNYGNVPEPAGGFLAMIAGVAVCWIRCGRRRLSRD